MRKDAALAVGAGVYGKEKDRWSIRNYAESLVEGSTDFNRWRDFRKIFGDDASRIDRYR